ncbi:hypothetical protein S40285_08750 [Stachybotrys chlorohalonatus IBT 40285]|uniref:Xylanolytic transcriptional activator regulatory domain-containing protein n=1 Tax=Stachybotrys chlorohalonatus (strain IBT 40285) TaxID=1283841 RepID=A0A084QV52_STAC4|nr:hypothetical protein S40285_08750 [Stachybotrys chlorohalonata IBT 40285]
MQSREATSHMEACNREKPCYNCSTRLEQDACTFRGHKTGAAPAAHRREANGEAMGQRIDQLEQLVKRLISERQTVPPTGICDLDYLSAETTKSQVMSPEASDADASPGAGMTIMEGDHSVYHGADDWYVVLQEINELKRAWSQDHDDLSDSALRSSLSHTVDGSSLLFNQVKPIERVEILSSLPHQPEVYRLISHFFNTKDFPIAVPPILHEPTFRREHCRDSSRTSLIWLGLLFSMLGITMLAYHQYGEPAEYQGITESLFQLYRMRTAQCLLSGDISKCLPYTVEALRFNATAELNRKDDNRRGLWIMTGVVIRAAINMGFHRDPSQSQGFSVLQAEYRRRVWLSVLSMDDMASFLGGFPRVTPAIHSDTEEPRNLHDWELSDDITVLPPSRPMSEPTSVTYLIAKGRLFRALGRVVDVNNNPGLVPYETILEVDQAVQEAYESFPPHMQVAPNQNGDGPVHSRANFSNLSLMAMYNRGICILHRKSLAKGRVDERYKFSRERCISSALALLTYQQGLEPSFYQLSETRHMLTLAAMVLCLELELRRRAPEENASLDSEVLLGVLERSSSCWAAAMGACDEAWKVHQFLTGMLAGFYGGTDAGTGTEPSHKTSPETPFDLTNFVPTIDADGLGFSFNKEFSSTEFDWATWDTFMNDSGCEKGPIY